MSGLTFHMIGALQNGAEQVAGEHEKIMPALQDRYGRAMQAHIESGYRLFKSNDGLEALFRFSRDRLTAFEVIIHVSRALEQGSHLGLCSILAGLRKLLSAQMGF